TSSFPFRPRRSANRLVRQFRLHPLVDRHLVRQCAGFFHQALQLRLELRKLLRVARVIDQIVNLIRILLKVVQLCLVAIGPSVAVSSVSTIWSTTRGSSVDIKPGYRITSGSRMLGSCMVRLSTIPCSPLSRPLSVMKIISVLSSCPISLSV